MESKMCTECAYGCSSSKCGDCRSNDFFYYLPAKDIKQIMEAKRMLKKYNYIAFRMTPRMVADLEECEKMGEDDIDKDCNSCSCFVCIAQYD